MQGRYGEHEGAHLDGLAEAHLLAEEAAAHDGQRRVAQLARHRVVPERVVDAAAARAGVLAPEERVEPARRGLTIEHPLQALPLEGVERQLQAGRIEHLVVARGLHRAHQPVEREGVRRGGGPREPSGP